MQPRFEILPQKKLVGKSSSSSFSNNNTAALWQNFMPQRKKITNSIGAAFYSVEIYDANFFNDFDPIKAFRKWAAVEVSDFDSVPEEMEILTIPTGLYAVFLHKGSAAEGVKTYRYIFTQWLPASEYELENRPHFALMGEKYKNDDPNSEEEIYIPVKFKTKQ